MGGDYQFGVSEMFPDKWAAFQAQILEAERHDMPCPVRYALALHQAWPDFEFHLIEGAGHAWCELGTLDQLIRATDHFTS